MDTLLRNVADHASVLLLALILGILVLSLATYILGKRLSDFHARWRDLLDDTSARRLEELLYDHLKERIKLQDEVVELKKRILDLEERAQTSKRYVGLVRYDAFADVGGSQSFALAVFDERGDGFVTTSLVGRNDCRVYCKSLAGGRSPHALSQEEERAIREARSSGPRAAVTT